jgi:glycosyltransferase involved in cell wall biosynthesis
MYGASQSLFILLEALHKEGRTELLVLARNEGHFTQALEAAGIAFKIIPYPLAVYTSPDNGLLTRWKEKRRYRREQRACWNELQSTCSAFRPQLIYTNTSVVSCGYALAAEQQLPHVWHIREYGYEDYKLHYLPSREAVVAAMNGSMQCIFVSKALRQHWLGAQSHAEVIYNACEPPLEKTHVQSAHAKKVISLVGAIHAGKNQLQALQAFRSVCDEFPEAELRFYGNVSSPAYKRELVNYIDQNGLKARVVFVPFEKDKSVLYRDTVLLLSCAGHEAFGRTIIEAMSAGIPVIANSNGGPGEIITDGANGWLYDGSTGSLADAIRAAFVNVELYTRIAENAKRDAQQRFSITQYTTQVQNVLQRCVRISD